MLLKQRFVLMLIVANVVPRVYRNTIAEKCFYNNTMGTNDSSVLYFSTSGKFVSYPDENYDVNSTHYVDPISGDMNNDGSYNSPWETLQGVFENELIETQYYETEPPGPNTPLIVKNKGAPVKAGDTILLRSGYHGEVDYKSAFNSDYITIAAQQRHTPYLKKFKLSAVSKWIIRGLTVSPELAPEGATLVYDLDKNGIINFQDFAMLAEFWQDSDCQQLAWCRGSDFDRSGKVDFTDLTAFVDYWLVENQHYKLMLIESHQYLGQSKDIIIENNILFSTQDSSGWTADMWRRLSGHGIHTNALNSIVRNNTLMNVYSAIAVDMSNALVEYNRIENFAGDGLVGNGDDQVWQYNLVEKSYNVDENHDDCLQIAPGPNHRVVIRGNVFIGYQDSNHPLVHGPQGIGIWDGPNYNFTIENNIVIVGHTNGIALFDAQDSNIVNNIVFNPMAYTSPSIWLGSKGLGGNNNIIVRNNIAHDFPANLVTIVSDHNLDVDDYEPNLLFFDYLNNDYRHRQGSPAIDSGSPESAPDVDIEGTKRPYGHGYDIGAWEYTLQFDLNKDEGVNFEDFAMLASFWRNSGCEQSDWCEDSDFDQSGIVDFADLAIFSGHWLQCNLEPNETCWD